MSIGVILTLGLIILITHFLEGITGFGCTIMAMPFTIMLVGIKTAKPTLTILATILCLYVVLISYRDIIWKHYFRIVFFMGLGLPLGIIMFNKLPEGILKIILSIFMIIVAVRGIIIAMGGEIQNKNLTVKKTNSYILNFLLFAAGCIHGAFTSGGPLVIIYASRALPDKSSFRATLCILWVTLNSIIIAQGFFNKSIGSESLTLTLYLLPFLAAGAVFGNWAHHKIKDSFFTKLVYISLFISAVFMML